MGNTLPDRRRKDFERVLGELERMARSDEAALIRQDFQHLADNQKLKSDFIGRLVALSEDGVPNELESRFAAFSQALSANASWLDDSMQANREELASLVKGRRTVRRLNRSYGTTDRPSARRTDKASVAPSRTRFIRTA